MDVDKLLVDYITHGIKNNRKNHVGLELEYPLVTKDGSEVPEEAVKKVFEGAEKAGFKVQRRSEEGLPIYAKDEAGNAVTFDTCYENLEYVTTSCPSMPPLYQRFREALASIQEALKPLGCMVLGVGYNALLGSRRPKMLKNELTLAIDRFFQQSQNPRAHLRYKDFYCSISSEQVHFNTSVEELPLIFETFTRLDWLNILLFSDSPAHLNGKDYLCARNELYMRSSFRNLGLVGEQELSCRSVEDIAKSYRKLGLFMRSRNGQNEVFSPVTVEEYFTDPRYGALAEDIHSLDIERNIITTAYGTVEYRVLCAQPFDEAFGPSAFSLGLRMRLKETLALARAFDKRFSPPEPNLRCEQASLGSISFAPRGEIESYAKALLALSRQGLEERGFGEEAFLSMLEKRPSILCSPAHRLMNRERKIGVKPALLERAQLGEAMI